MIKLARREYVNFLRKVFSFLEESESPGYDMATVNLWLRRVMDEDIAVEKIFTEAKNGYRPRPEDWQAALVNVSHFDGQWKYRNQMRPEIFSSFDLEVATAFGVVPVYIHGKKIYFAVIYPLNFTRSPEIFNYLQNMAGTRVGEDADVGFLISRGDEIRRLIERYSYPGGLRSGELDFVQLLSNMPGLPVGLSIGDSPSNLKALAADLDTLSADREEVSGDGIQPMGDGIQPMGVHDTDNRAGRFCDGIIAWAYKNNASDFHVKPEYDPSRNRFFGRVLFQTPGGIIPDAKMSPESFRQVVARFKVVGRMDVSTRLDPQDGNISLSTPEGIYVIRLSTSPVQGGEWVCGRLFPQKVKTIENLGLDSEQLILLKHHLSMSQGMILFSGPTGSGKSTSLAASMTHIRDSRSISSLMVTIEDPIEQWLPGANIVQREFREKRDKSMANIIREMMRKNPGVIMVGEIRDSDTASTAFRAVLTGHLLLSTVHANGSAAAFTRLVDLGVERFKVAYTILSVHQRLVPKACEHCREIISPGSSEFDAQLKSIGEFGSSFGCSSVAEISQLVRVRGCNQCQSSGYKGYVPLFEFLPVTTTIKNLILQGANSSEIMSLAQKESGTKTIPEQAMALIVNGITTSQAVYHACALA